MKQTECDKYHDTAEPLPFREYIHLAERLGLRAEWEKPLTCYPDGRTVQLFTDAHRTPIIITFCTHPRVFCTVQHPQRGVSSYRLDE